MITEIVVFSLMVPGQTHDASQKAGEYRKNPVTRTASLIAPTVRSKIASVDARFAKLEGLVKAAYPSPIGESISYSVLPFQDNDVLPGLPSYSIRWGHQPYFYDNGRSSWRLEDVTFTLEQVVNGIPESALAKIRRPNALGTERQVAKLAGDQVYTLPLASGKSKDGEEWFEYTPNQYVAATKASMVVVSTGNDSIFVRCSLSQYLEFMKSLAQDDSNAEMAQLAASSSPDKKWEQTVKKTLATRVATIDAVRKGNSAELLAAPVKLLHGNIKPNQLDNAADFAKEIAPTGGGYNLVTIRKMKPNIGDATIPQFIAIRWDYDLGVPFMKRFHAAMTDRFDVSALHRMIGK